MTSRMRGCGDIESLPRVKVPSGWKWSPMRSAYICRACALSGRYGSLEDPSPFTSVDEDED